MGLPGGCPELWRHTPWAAATADADADADDKATGRAAEPPPTLLPTGARGVHARRAAGTAAEAPPVTLLLLLLLLLLPPPPLQDGAPGTARTFSS
mmetsp:Transcript_148812/g.477984  ORF Transcript_148812/g.477984 Transcript_148812/m.477984 type:complete len:95 (+) Transcript_148812:360-644(+)